MLQLDLAGFLEWAKLALMNINSPVYGTLSLFESVTIILVIIGLIMAYNGVEHASARLRYLKQSGKNGILKLIADENLRVEIRRRTLLYCVLASVSIAALVPNRPDVEYGWAGALVSLTYMAMVLFLVKSAYQAMRYRMRLDNHLEELEREAEAAAAHRTRRKGDMADANQMGLSGSQYNR